MSGPELETYELGRFLRGKQWNETSQFGEDGLIAEVLFRIGVVNKWCFEVGAADGLFFSNTSRLRDAGWNAVLIEANDVQYGVLESIATDRVKVVHATATPQNIDGILSGAGCPEKPDFGVIDIDGEDYYLWEGMEKHRPRLMLVECAPAWSTTSNSEPFESDNQATADQLIKLSDKKGYEPLCRTYCNLVLIERLSAGNLCVSI